jgi:hypothetical protein
VRPAGASAGQTADDPRLRHTAYTLAGAPRDIRDGVSDPVAGTAVLTESEPMSVAGGVAAPAGEIFPSLVARDVALAEERRSAVFEEGLARLAEAVQRAAGRERSWLARLRAGLVALLGFFDDEPVSGRLLLGEAPGADRAVALRCEQRVLGVLAGLLEDAPARPAARASCSSLLAELIAGGVFGVIRARLLEGGGAERESAEGGSAGGESAPLVELAPSLMAFIVAPYLGQAAASVELSGRPAPFEERGPGGRRLYATRRTRLVLSAIAAAPRSSNREIAQAAGLVDEGQTSKLLRRLAERGLIENVGSGQHGGRSNAWLLTSRGEWTLSRFGEPAGGGCSA